jgi:hypothetical protein
MLNEQICIKCKRYGGRAFSFGWYCRDVAWNLLWKVKSFPVPHYCPYKLEQEVSKDVEERYL